MDMVEGEQGIPLSNEERLELENIQLKLVLAEKEMQEQFTQRGRILDQIREKHGISSDAKLALNIDKNTISVLKTVPKIEEQEQVES